jgi:hypothetical protein
MGSKKNHTRRSHKKSSSTRRQCKGGRKSRSRNKRTEKKHNKWLQRGCQSGGGGVTGGWPWAPSDVHPQTAGSGAATAAVVVPHSINGNHYSLNTETMAPAQSSNHLVEKGQFGGGSKKHTRGRGRGRGRRRHHRYVGEQYGGMAEYLPEVANTSARGLVEIPASVMNSLQGASTAFRTSDPTVQPIGQAIQLS